MGTDLSGADARPTAGVPVPDVVATAAARRHVEPGAVLAWASVAPAVVAIGWLLVAFPLGLAGRATPLLAVPAAIPAIGLLLLAARRLPPVPATTWGPVVGSLGVAAGFTALSAAFAGGHVVLRRDSAVYALVTRWVADTGTLVAPAQVDLIGRPDPVVGVAAPGLYEAGDSLTMQFMPGTALALAPAGWAGGWGAILTGPAVLGGLALLAVAGLAARLLGPRWAPAAALAVGLAQPVLLTARSTYSEPLAQLLLFAALCLLLDAVAGRDRGLAALAGLGFGLGLLVRLDALRDLVLLIPVVAWLAARRHPGWLLLAAGTLLGTAYGVLGALVVTRAYVSDLWPSVRPAVAGAVALTALAAVAVPLARRGTPWLLTQPWWPRARDTAAAAAALGMAGVLGWLALRPLVWAGHGTVQAGPFIESLQRNEGLPADGSRNYAEQSVRWASWYVGWPALALAASAAVLLTWRAVRGDRDAGRWALGLGVPLVSALTVLEHPAITPDHPWADRRLVPTVLPVVVLLALWSVGALARTAARRVPARWAGRAAAAVVAAGLVAMLLPAEAGSRSLRGARTERGEPAALQAACAAFGPDDVAVLVDARSRQEWTAPLRLGCGIPAFAVPGTETDRTATPAELADVTGRIRAAGRRPVLVAQSSEPLPGLTTAPQRQVVDLDTWEHQRLITRPPRGLDPLSVELWIAEPG